MLCHVFWSQVEYKIVCFIYGILVDAEALEIESNVVGSSPAWDIVIGEPRTIGLKPNIAFNSFSL